LALYRDELAGKGIWKGRKASAQRQLHLERKIAELEKLLDPVE
jgi:hypothetical protein